MRAIFFILFCCRLSASIPPGLQSDQVAGESQVASGGGGGGSGQSFSDDFDRANGDSLGANWTEAAGDIDIASNQAAQQSGSFAKVLAIYSGQATDTAVQYCKVTVVTPGGNPYAEIVLRYTDSSSPYYTLGMSVSDDTVQWLHYANVAGSSTDVSSASAMTFASTFTVGVTITGTGDSTIVRVWNAPTADAPTSASSWDGEAADVEFTDNPASPVNTGAYIGLEAYGAAAADVAFNNFFGGDVP